MGVNYSVEIPATLKKNLQNSAYPLISHDNMKPQNILNKSNQGNSVVTRNLEEFLVNGYQWLKSVKAGIGNTFSNDLVEIPKGKMD